MEFSWPVDVACLLMSIFQQIYDSGGNRPIHEVLLPILQAVANARAPIWSALADRMRRDSERPWFSGFPLDTKVIAFLIARLVLQLLSNNGKRRTVYTLVAEDLGPI